MYGHVETDVERMRHLDLLRSIQQETGGFTEFVPLSFVHEEAPMTLQAAAARSCGPGPTGQRGRCAFRDRAPDAGRDASATSRCRGSRRGCAQAQWLLACGANDLGGTLMNESISTSAGAAHGQLHAPSALRRAIRDAGRVPAERNTRYEVLRTFADGSDRRGAGRSSGVADPEAAFGSYERADARRALQVSAPGRERVRRDVVVGRVDVEGDALVVDDREAQAGGARGLAVGGEAVVAAEATWRRRSAAPAPARSCGAHVIADQRHVVIGERGEERRARRAARCRGRSPMRTIASPRPQALGLGEGTVDDRGERSTAASRSTSRSA